MWCSRSLTSEHYTSCVSSLVLDTSDKHLQKKFSKSNRFIYRFMRQDLPPPDGKAYDMDSLGPASSPIKNMDCALRTGDYVVWIFLHNYLAVHFSPLALI